MILTIIQIKFRGLTCKSLSMSGIIMIYKLSFFLALMFEKNEVLHKSKNKKINRFYCSSSWKMLKVKEKLPQ